jgi:phage FluMu protein gp41
MLTEKVQLLDGLEYDGARQQQVTLRAGIVSDTMEAERKTGDRGLVFLSLAMLAEQITEFGKIPKEKVTADLLSGLSEADFERLLEAREVLKKKAAWSPRD